MRASPTCAARLLELGRVIDQLKARAAADWAEAHVLAPDLEAAEEQVRLAIQARDRVAAEIRYHQGDARDAEQTARVREREIDDLAAEAGRPRTTAPAFA